MKNLAKIITLLSILFYYGNANAQLTVNAGGSQDSMGICSGISITLGGNPTANGGTPPYTYAWAPDSSLSCNTCSNPVATPLVTTDYTVTVTDHAGNSATGSAYINVWTTPSLTVTDTHDTANYFRMDTLYATATAGVWQVFYEWNANGINMDGNSTNSGNYLTYNYPGTFVAWATNENAYSPGGCADTVITYIHGGLNVSVSSYTNNVCYYDNSGAINISTTGGTGTYFYVWNNGATTQNVSDLPVGTYSVTVYDGLGNVGYVSQQITAASQLFASIDISPNLGFPDTLTAVPSGGTPPYSYAWSNLTMAQSDIISASGQYNVTVTDYSGCTVTSGDFIGIIANNDSLDVAENSSSTLNVLQNVQYEQNFQSQLFWYPIVSYNSNPLHGTAVLNENQTISYTPATNYIGSDSFIYVACLGDSNFNGQTQVAYCDTAVVYLNVIDSIYINLIVNPASCPTSCDGGIQMSLSGGVSPYTYAWSSPAIADTAQNPTGLCAGTTYTITVTDANHATAMASATITNNAPPLNINWYADNSSEITIQAMAGYYADSSSPWIFTWSNGDVDTSFYESDITVTQSGHYCVTVTSSATACILTACSDSIGCVGCVWPGDANEDGVVDNNDLLPIGLAYGSTGPVRPGASNSWVGQQCEDWVDTFSTGINYKFADCNGDGIIDANDTVPVLLNFGFTHVRSGTTRKDWVNGQPALNVTLTPDTLSNGEILMATFSLGSAALPASNVYGLAFTFNYDPQVIDSTKTQVSFGDSWVGTSNKISVAKDFGSVGQVECALTRIDHVTASGFGTIGTTKFVITTDNINGMNLKYYNLQTWISNLQVIDNIGNQLQFNEGSDTAVIQPSSATGINEINADAAIRLFPNPAHDQLIIQSQNQLAMQEITLIDLLGNTVIRQTVTQPYQTTIDVSSLGSGAYFLRVETANGTAMERFVVAR